MIPNGPAVILSLLSLQFGYFRSPTEDSVMTILPALYYQGKKIKLYNNTSVCVVVVVVRREMPRLNYSENSACNLDVPHCLASSYSPVRGFALPSPSGSSIQYPGSRIRVSSQFLFLRLRQSRLVTTENSIGERLQGGKGLRSFVSDAAGPFVIRTTGTGGLAH